ncbi:MAG TPA: ATPase, T2SS/T4P/T4SS family [Burkholderiaceae bacterium]|nr:ATPase, T2SS/T4P/T4SS family [Burkholderiaceae bacterium]
MLLITIEQAGAAPQSMRIERLPCRIGRGRDCDLVLPSWRVGREHAEIHSVGRGLRIIDLGTLSGTMVNGERIAEFGPLGHQDEIDIAGYRLRVQTERDPPAVALAGGASVADAPVAWRRLVHRQLLQTIDLRRRDLRQIEPAQLRADIRGLVEQIVAEQAQMPGSIDTRRLVDDVLDEAVGLGPLERLLEDPTVSEIMVNAAQEIWVERAGKLSRCAAAFSDDDAIRNIIDRIVAPLGRRIDEASPMVDARLPDGSRVNAVIPPLALKGPAVTIRRFNRRLLSVDDLQQLGTASAAMLQFLDVCVSSRRNIIVSGGTGSGKTTLLNVLSNLIPPHERIITIEDAAELALRHEHLVQLESRPANLEGRGEVTIRDLVRNALRMRPDRIVVGECRSGEALDMLQAMNTGHDGSLTTVHANSPRDVISRLEVMVLMAGFDLPVAAIREQVASAVDVIVHLARYADGGRRIASIVEVTGVEAGRVLMQQLFRHCLERPDGAGHAVACGIVPTFYEALRSAGAQLDLSIFAPVAPASA